MAEKILKRLKYSSEIIRKVRLFVDNHMFYYNVDEVGASSVRRLVRKVGLENIDDLIDLRVGDRLGFWRAESRAIQTPPFQIYGGQNFTRSAFGKDAQSQRQ